MGRRLAVHRRWAAVRRIRGCRKAGFGQTPDVRPVSRAQAEDGSRESTINLGRGRRRPLRVGRVRPSPRQGDMQGDGRATGGRCARSPRQAEERRRAGGDLARRTHRLVRGVRTGGVGDQAPGDPEHVVRHRLHRQGRHGPGLSEGGRGGIDRPGRAHHSVRPGVHGGRRRGGDAPPAPGPPRGPAALGGQAGGAGAALQDALRQ